jgi:hypothetical protein
MTYTKTFRLALAKAGITDYVRPFHDMRHSSLTNGAAAGMSMASLKSRAGHASFSTTEGYLHIAGVEFAAEDAKLGARLWGFKEPWPDGHGRYWSGLSTPGGRMMATAAAPAGRASPSPSHTRPSRQDHQAWLRRRG